MEVGEGRHAGADRVEGSRLPAFTLTRGGESPYVHQKNHMSEAVTTKSYESANHTKHTANNWFYRKHLEAFYEHLSDVVDATGCTTLLDAGCGEGFVVDLLTREHPDLKITGVDISDDAIEYAKEHFGEKARFRTGSVYKLPFSDNSFDAVLCSEVLEHVDDPNRAVAELKRVARDYVVITVPLEPYFQWLNNISQWLRLGPELGHVNFWTSRTFPDFIRAHFDDAEFTWKQLYQVAVAKV